nr:PKD domain-containing protein [Planosporangium thailandense]
MGRDPEKLYVADPRAGTYRYEVDGVTGGDFALTLADEGGNTATRRATISGSVTAGGTVKVEAVRAADGTTTTTTVPQFTPEAVFTAPERIVTAQDLQVDAPSSFDADGRIVDWAWDFGDGSTGHGRRASHGYQAPGEYDVRLTVTDDGGASRSVTRHVSVAPTEEYPPTVQIAPADGPFHRDAFDVAVSATDSDRGVRSMTYQATGATTVPETTVDGGGPVNLRIAAEGATTVTVRAVDRDGNRSAPASMVVGVDTVPPVSRVTTPLAGGSTAGLGILAGSVSGTTAGAKSVEVSLTRTADGKSWDGSAWVAGERWLPASVTSGPDGRWSIANHLPSGGDLPKCGYRVRSRAVDVAGNAETPGRWPSRVARTRWPPACRCSSTTASRPHRPGRP